jgi:hypothetical protein
MPALMNRLTLELVTELETEAHRHWCPAGQKFWEHEGDYDSCPFKRVQRCLDECSGGTCEKEASSQSVVS